MSDRPETISTDRAYRAAGQIVEVLRDAGYTAYFAGGCVRDEIMGRVPSDYDVATDAPPPQVLELFHKAHYVGEAFGVVMVRLSGAWIEVATFRTDVGYTDGRHPDRVEFTDAEHDAQRRDFTINGLFRDPLEDRIIDYVGGVDDIHRRTIRAIGEPERRFSEDYLRMLRAVRFAARFHFEIEPATFEAIRHHASKLRQISRERIAGEVQTMMADPGRSRAAHLMAELRLDGPVLNEDHLDREPIVMSRLPDRVTHPVALAAWMVDRHLSPHRPRTLADLIRALERMKVVQIVRRWRKALVLSNHDRDRVQQLCLALPRVAGWNMLDTAQRKRSMAQPYWEELVVLLGATTELMMAEVFDWPLFEAQTEELFRQGVDPVPLLTGDDLIAAGFSPGPAFKRVLDAVYDAQLAGDVQTAPEALDLARSLLP